LFATTLDPLTNFKSVTCLTHNRAQGKLLLMFMPLALTLGMP
jgi:hypothetical protein